MRFSVVLLVDDTISEDIRGLIYERIKKDRGNEVDVLMWHMMGTHFFNFIPTIMTLILLKSG